VINEFRTGFSRIGLTDWIVLCTDMLLAIPTIWDLTGTLQQFASEKNEEKYDPLPIMLKEHRERAGVVPGSY